MKIIFPPRPKGKIKPEQLASYELTGKWLAQRKYNGDRSLIHVDADGSVQVYSRYGRKHQQYKPPVFLLQELRQLNFVPGRTYWLDAELIHPLVDHTLVLFDVLESGKYLLGMSQVDRLLLLANLCRISPATGTKVEQVTKISGNLANPAIAWRVLDHVWMAPTFSSGFMDHYREFLNLDVIEGLVLRKIEGRLDNLGHREYEVDWQLRCRKPGPKGNYRF